MRIHEDDFSGPEAVDLKLVKLSKLMDARICTTDFNLSRIASIQGIEMLNINDLVNAVKPVVFTGEELEIKLLKEGKEANQAIGYLEDGTMVVAVSYTHLVRSFIMIIMMDCFITFIFYFLLNF